MTNSYSDITCFCESELLAEADSGSAVEGWGFELISDGRESWIVGQCLPRFFERKGG